MHPKTLVDFPAVLFFEISRTVISTCCAGVALFIIAGVGARKDVAESRGLDKIVALSNFCFALPLAVFAAEHFSAARGIMQLVPKFVPWPLFWTYFVGVGLLAASLSIATKIGVRWSGLLFGIMMFLFVAMMDLPGTIAKPHDRIAWTLMLREMSFGAGGWCLAASAMTGRYARSNLAMVGRIVIGIAAIFYGVQHFLHPANVPGVPLEKLLPAWIPAHALISYLTGLTLVVCGVLIVLATKTHIAAAYLGGWILLLVLLVYGPILVTSLMDPGTAVKVEGINYFFDTLLYAGTILALAKASPASD